jgi:hypothetical protein
MLKDPLPLAVRAALREAVLDLKARHHTLSFPPEIQLARPGSPTIRWRVVDELSSGVRSESAMLGTGLEVDVMRSLLKQPSDSSPPEHDAWIWLARPGELTWHDLDAVWLAAARCAHEEAGWDLTMAVLTKQGWYDPRSGCSRRWKRLRSR